MKIKNSLQRSITGLFCTAIVLMISSPADAESIFLRNGSVTEGTIISENDRTIKIKSTEGKQHEILRKDVLRILNHIEYKQKKYIYKTDNSLIEAFIVDEDKHFYTYRIDLNSTVENKILKTEIETISKKKIEFGSEKKTRMEEIVTRASRISLAFGLFDQYPEFDMAGMSVLKIDLNLYRMRNKNGNGFDFFATILHKEFDGGDLPFAEASRISGIYGYTLQGIESTPDPDIGFSETAAGAGVRYIHGYYLGGILWQGYLSGSVTRLWHIFSEFSSDSFTRTQTARYVAGAGIEAALFPYIGVFSEASYAYTPAAKNYKGLATLYFGVTLRTSYL